MHVTLAGSIRVHEGFPSRYFKNRRSVIVYLPPDYESARRHRYPVCYLHDGQNLFDPKTAFLGQDWGLQDTLDDLICRREIDPLIVAGIYNAGERRAAEYTLISDQDGVGGGASAYGRAIIRDLKPFIDREYRTRPGARNTALGGSSLGGLVSIYLGLQHPEVFGNLIAMSPSVWWADRHMLRYVQRHRCTPGQKIWLDIGTAEAEDSEVYVNDVRRLRDALIAKGWKLARDLKFVEEEGAAHNERAWGKRMRHALRFLFPVSGTFVG